MDPQWVTTVTTVSRWVSWTAAAALVARCGGQLPVQIEETLTLRLRRGEQQVDVVVEPQDGQHYNLKCSSSEQMMSVSSSLDTRSI